MILELMGKEHTLCITKFVLSVERRESGNHMRICKKTKDGGPDSPVDGYFLIEIKGLFSIVLLHFNGTREAYHSHAFNAVTLWLKGRVFEAVRTEDEIKWHKWAAGNIKYTPRNLMHKISPTVDSWALSFRGPWKETWQEFKDEKYVTLAHGRKIID